MPVMVNNAIKLWKVTYDKGGKKDVNVIGCVITNKNHIVFCNNMSKGTCKMRKSDV